MTRSPATISQRLAALDWRRITNDLDDAGFAVTRPVLTAGECRHMISLYEEDSTFRSRVMMERYRFGVGDYAYFSHPLPNLVAGLRSGLYRRLAPVANRWTELLGKKECFPPTLGRFIHYCGDRGQAKPTPLLLRYSEGGYNRLHNDLYGDVVFPLQATLFLSRKGDDYQGGESLLVEQHPRNQSIGHSVSCDRGSMLIFASDQRPVEGKRGHFRARMRHGVSRVTKGSRYTLGIIFHDAR